MATPRPPDPTATPTATVVSVEVGYKVGQRAPDFLVTAVNGQEFSLASFQGRPVILYFFATW
ncbi:MAG: redoxin domain-containing protein [Chloroflexi bacterium]|nr:redoxin domain-containing protein [Chloroflexota bacterium]